MTTYTKYGPFTDGVGTPGLSAEFANAVENTLVSLTTPATSTQNAITGWFHADAYGAVGDATTDDTTALQNTLNAAATKFAATGTMQRAYLPPRIHLVSAVTYYNDDSSVSGAVSLMLPSGVDFFGPGTIRVKAGAYGSGALYGVIRSKSGGINSSKVREISIDGNKANNVASVQCSNILLNCTAGIEIRDTQQYNVNGNGILLSGTTSSPATDLRIKNNTVSGCTAIGIQASQFNGLDIDNNIVSYCTDNGIDIYGENGTTSSSGTNFRITNNRVYNCSVGIFPETVAYGLVANNHLSNNVNAGIHVNRINGAPTAVVLQGNELISNPIGIYVTGDMGSVFIKGNTIAGASTAGIQMGGGGGALSHVYIADNFIDTATLNSTPLILTASGTTTWSQSWVTRTLTQNTNRTYDLVNNASTTTAVTANPANNS